MSSVLSPLTVTPGKPSMTPFQPACACDADAASSATPLSSISFSPSFTDAIPSDVKEKFQSLLPRDMFFTVYSLVPEDKSCFYYSTSIALTGRPIKSKEERRVQTEFMRQLAWHEYQTNFTLQYFFYDAANEGNVEREFTNATCVASDRQIQSMAVALVVCMVIVDVDPKTFDSLTNLSTGINQDEGVTGAQLLSLGKNVQLINCNETTHSTVFLLRSGNERFAALVPNV